MDIKTLEQALKLQSNFTSQLTKSMASQRTGKMPSIEVTLQEKEKLIAQAQAEVEIAIKERDVAVRRWDERIMQRKEYVAKLKEELNNINKRHPERNISSKVKKSVNSKKEPLNKKPQ